MTNPSGTSTLSGELISLLNLHTTSVSIPGSSSRWLDESLHSRSFVKVQSAWVSCIFQGRRHTEPLVTVTDTYISVGEQQISLEEKVLTKAELWSSLSGQLFCNSDHVMCKLFCVCFFTTRAH